MKKQIVAIGIALAIAIPAPALANTTLIKWVSIDPGRANAAKSRPFTLTHGTRKFTASSTEARQWFKTRSGGNGTQLQLRPGAIYSYLNVKVSPVVNDLGEQSRFRYVDGNLHLTKGGRKGKIVDGVKTSLAIRQAVRQGKSSAKVHFKQHRPAIFSAADYRSLKFPHKLATGQSNFAGSPANRRHNIAVATARYDGLVIMPGEEFSFNQYLGEVDAANGYLPELVIKNNVTTPEYGGGICQVSTTAFRAAMESGLHVTSRRNHSYPVKYYGSPGYDATVYAPWTDLKFANDTGNPVRLNTSISGSILSFEVWGTSDGREVTVNGPFTTAKHANGNITAAVAQIVTKNGRSLREKNYVSTYQPASKFPEVSAANGG